MKDNLNIIGNILAAVMVITVVAYTIWLAVDKYAPDNTDSASTAAMTDIVEEV